MAVDFQHEADGCFRLAETETDADLRTVLMGMGYGWLTLARHRPAAPPRRAPLGRHDPFDEPTDEPEDLLP